MQKMVQDKRGMAFKAGESEELSKSWNVHGGHPRKCLPQDILGLAIQRNDSHFGEEAIHTLRSRERGDSRSPDPWIPSSSGDKP